MQKLTKKFTRGSIIKPLLALSIPIVLANILATAYHFTDTFWVGRLGAEAVAAVSLSFPIIFLFISLASGLSMAGSILVAQYKGKEDKKNIDYISAQTLVLVILVTIPLSITGFFLSGYILNLMGAEPVVLKNATSYLQISFIGMVFIFIYFAFQSLMRGIGEVRKPLYIVLFSVILNLFLDPLFILGYDFIPAFGVSGAALATIGTESIASFIGIFILFSGKYEIKLKLENMKPDFRIIKKMFRLGFPASMEQITRSLAILVMAFLVASFGTITIASYGIGSRILSFIIIPAFGFSMATSTLVGQNIGAGKIERAKKTVKISLIFSFLLLSFVGIFTFIFSENIARFFIPDNTSVISSASFFIKIMSVSFGFIGIQQVINGTFRGSGNTLIPMILSIISLWVLRFPIAYILSKHILFNETGIWWAFAIGDIIAGVIALIWFKFGKWEYRKITDEYKRF